MGNTLVFSMMTIAMIDRVASADLKPDYGTIIGIDLGTTYSCVAVYQNGRMEVIPNDQGNRLTPSAVAFTPGGQRIVGDSASYQLTSNPENTIVDVKRLIGRKWDDVTVQNEIKHLPFRVIDSDNKPSIQVNIGRRRKTFAPQEISAMVLSYLKKTAEAYLGKNVTYAVVTVPAYFTDAQRQATKDAGMIAGLSIARLINEPTAAAMAYGFDKQMKAQTILVFDLGGGTLDVSLLNIDMGVYSVLATNGNTNLGGEDFSNRVVDHYVKKFKANDGIDLRQHTKALQKLRREVEKAKRELSYSYQAEIKMDYMIHGLEILTRAKFEELNKDLFKSTLTYVGRVLDDAGIGIAEVGELVLVGGSTRIPKIQQLVKEYFMGKEISSSITPDEAVARGAALQASILGGHSDANDRVLIDVNPLTLGFENSMKNMVPLIPRNCIIPVKKSKLATTAKDNQPNIFVQVYEGENPMTKDNNLLGTFVMDVQPAPRGVPQIEVTYEIDSSGILQATAEDVHTKAQVSVTINRMQGSIPMEDFDRMVNDADKFEVDEREARKLTQSRDDLERLAYQLKKRLSDDLFTSKLNEKDKTILQNVVTEHISWLDVNHDASAEEYDKQKESLLNILSLSCVQPILLGLHQDSVKERDEL